MSSSSLLSIRKRYRKYSHKALAYHKPQLRLIMVEPDLYGPIRCSVEVFDLDSAPAYAALSYTWGPEFPVYDILIEGRALSIRKNLHQFLKCWRKDKKHPWQMEGLYLFVDQICIDQSDPDERNRQVQLMSQIYYKSSVLIVWLNDKQGQSTKAARELNRSSKKSSSLANLLVNDYFTRLWIVQEILLAPWLWLYTPGGLWVSWETLWKAVRLIPSGVFEGEPGFPAWEPVPINTLKLVDLVIHPSAPYRTSAPWKSAPSPNNLSWSRFVSKAGRRTELAEILKVLTFSANTCYEPRDKVYGLMNLLTVEHRLIVDYNKPVYDVFKDLILELHSVIQFKDDKDYSRWAIATQKLGADMGIDSDDVIDLLALLEFMRLIVPSKARVSEGAILPALVSKIGVVIEDAPGASSSERFGVASGHFLGLQPGIVPRKDSKIDRNVEEQGHKPNPGSKREFVIFQQIRNHQESPDTESKSQQWESFVQSIAEVCSLQSETVHFSWYYRLDDKVFKYHASPNWELIFRISPFRVARIIKEYEEERHRDETSKRDGLKTPYKPPATAPDHAQEPAKDKEDNAGSKQSTIFDTWAYRFVYGSSAKLTLLVIFTIATCWDVVTSLFRIVLAVVEVLLSLAQKFRTAHRRATAETLG